MTKTIHRISYIFIFAAFLLTIIFPASVFAAAAAPEDPNNCPYYGTLQGDECVRDIAVTPAYSRCLPISLPEGGSWLYDEQKGCHYTARVDCSDYPGTSSYFDTACSKYAELDNGEYTCPEGTLDDNDDPDAIRHCLFPIGYTCHNGGTLQSAVCIFGERKNYPESRSCIGAIAVISNGKCRYPATKSATATVMSDSLPESDVYVSDKRVVQIDGERGEVKLQNGATLKGYGKVGKLTVETGSTLAPGHSPGVITSDDLVLQGTYEVEIGGTTPGNSETSHDQTKVVGTVDLSGSNVTTVLYGGFIPTVGQTYTIIDNDGSDAVTGTFDGLAEGATFESQGVTYKVSYVAGDGNDVSLEVVSIDVSKLPSAPDTGFGIGLTNPAITLAATTVSGGALLLLSRRFVK